MQKNIHSKFISCDRDTLYLMPQSIQNWLPEKHMARFVVEILEKLDITNLENKYSSMGRKAYPIRMLLGLMFYGYTTGVYSSRKIEQATYDSVAFRYIAANMNPDHATIANFRKSCSKELDNIFLQILLIASEMGILKVGNVSTDGTKIKANASKHKALSWEYANKLEQQLKDEIDKLKQMAETEDNIPEGMVIPEELARREKRLEVITAAQEEISRRAKIRFEREQTEYEEKIARQKEYEKNTGKKKPGKALTPPIPGPVKKDQVNLTDSESRIMPKSGGAFEQSYNAQISVDIESMLVVGRHVTQNTNDKLEIVPALKELEKTELSLQKKFSGMGADAGYFSKDNVQHCENVGIVPYIALKREEHNKSVTERFEFTAEVIPENADSATKMQHRLQTKEGKAIYAKRKSTVEPTFGIIKHVMGFKSFLLRGFEAVQSEWKIVTTAWNIKRIFALTK